jgi:hypothetical protein
LIAITIGCGDDSTGGTGGSGATGGSAGTGGTGGIRESVTLSLTATEGFDNISDPPLAGVEFCETDTVNCATSDADGRATLEVEVPADGRISYTYTKDGFLSGLRTDVVDEEFDGVYGNFNLSDETMTALAADLMTPYPLEGTGIVALTAVVTGALPVFIGFAGATFELVDAAGRGYYTDPSGELSLDLTETTLVGGGGFIEVEPGEVEVRLGGNCVVLKGWPGSEANTVRVPVKADFVTWGSVSCEMN